MAYAKKEDINKLTMVITEMAKTINDLKKQKQEIPGTADMLKIKESETYKQIEERMGNISMIKEEEGGVDMKMPIPPAWRKMVDEILGMDFGIDVVYPQSGSGFLFKVIVPAEKSNASQSYKEFYKVDIRTKALSYSDGVDGIRKFCELVKTNLGRKQ